MTPLKCIIHVMNKQKIDIVPSGAGPVADAVQRYIVSNDLSEGDRLPTHDRLCDAIGVGARRLREGLSVLEHQGLIETRSKAGTIVRKPSAESLQRPFRWHLEANGYEVDHLIRARACIEGSAAWEAASHRKARDLLVLLDALECLDAKADSGELDLDEEEHFHKAVLQATHNPVMLTFDNLIVTQIWNIPEIADIDRVSLVSNREHHAIYEAIEARDQTAAMQIMYDHVLRKYQDSESYKD